MSEIAKGPGDFAWIDLTLRDPSGVKSFYKNVCGWTFSDHDMGDYADTNVHNAAGDVIAGICHAKGDNSGMPPVWMPYVLVPSLRDAVDAATQVGGHVVQNRGSFAILKDPSGAHIAVYEASGQ